MTHSNRITLLPAALALIVAVPLGHAHGASRAGWLGITARGPDDSAGAKRDAPLGAAVLRVVEGGPAHEAGLQAGDTIVAFGGRDVGSPTELARLVRDARPDTVVSVELLRAGARRTLQVMIGRHRHVLRMPFPDELPHVRLG